MGNTHRAAERFEASTIGERSAPGTSPQLKLNHLRDYSRPPLHKSRRARDRARELETWLGTSRRASNVNEPGSGVAFEASRPTSHG